MKPATWSAIALVVLAAVWFSWMFRYAHVGQALFLDRWTGEMVSAFDGERFDLNAQRDKESPAVSPDKANPFLDLIPRDQGR